MQKDEFSEGERVPYDPASVLFHQVSSSLDEVELMEVEKEKPRIWRCT